MQVSKLAKVSERSRSILKICLLTVFDNLCGQFHWQKNKPNFAQLGNNFAFGQIQNDAFRETQFSLQSKTRIYF